MSRSRLEDSRSRPATADLVNKYSTGPLSKPTPVSNRVRIVFKRMLASLRDLHEDAAEVKVVKKSQEPMKLVKDGRLVLSVLFKPKMRDSTNNNKAAQSNENSQLDKREANIDSYLSNRFVLNRTARPQSGLNSQRLSILRSKMVSKNNSIVSGASQSVS